MYRIDRVCVCERERNSVARVDLLLALSELHGSPFAIHPAVTHDVVLDGHIMFVHVGSRVDVKHPRYRLEWGDVQHCSFLTDYEKAIGLGNLCWANAIEFRVRIAGASWTPVLADSPSNPLTENALTIHRSSMAWDDVGVFSRRPWTLLLFRALDFLVYLDPIKRFVFLEVTCNLYWCIGRAFLLT